MAQEFFLSLRRLRSSRLEGRTMEIQWIAA